MPEIMEHKILDSGILAGFAEMILELHLIERPSVLGQNESVHIGDATPFCL
jgi:hypothetical protein